jgi:Phosphodiester glycosidase
VHRSVRPGPDGWTGPEGRGAPNHYWDPADPPTDPGYPSGPDYDWDQADPPTDPRYPAAPHHDPGPADMVADPRYRGARDDEDWNLADPATDPRYRGAPDHEDWNLGHPATDPGYRGAPDHEDWNLGHPVADPRYPAAPHHDPGPADTVADPRYPAAPHHDPGPADTVADPRYRGARDDEDWNLADPAIDPRYRGAPDQDRDPDEPTGPQPIGPPPRRQPPDGAPSGGLPPGGRRRHRPGGPPARGRQPGARKRRPLRKRMWVRITLGLLATFLAIVAWSVGNALTVPGGGTVSDRLAEWARDHYLGPAVTFGEWLTYRAPKAGGKPSFALTGPTAPTHPAKVRKKAAASFPPPAPLQSLAGKPLPGEGQWRVLATVHGIPAIYGTDLRASSVYSSYVSGIVSLNQQLVRFELRPGSEDPGPGNWKALPYIAPGTRLGLLATFNSGFKIAQSGGGFYLNGAADGALTRGVASVVYYQDGHVSIGAWRQTVRMTPDVVGVRQNLHLIVENGMIPASVDSNVESSWGATLGGGYYVWRSGIGITRDGRIIFVYGPALNVRELAQLLKRAGAVTAMQLDINPEWMSFMYYLPGHHPANPTPVALLPNQMQAANRYYSITGRDFTAVYAR